MSEFDGSYLVILANMVGFGLAFLWFVTMCVVALRWVIVSTTYRMR